MAVVTLFRLVGVSDDFQAARLPFDLAVLGALLGLGYADKDGVAEEEVHGLGVHLETNAVSLDGQDGSVPVNVWFVVAEPV